MEVPAAARPEALEGLALLDLIYPDEIDKSTYPRCGRLASLRIEFFSGAQLCSKPFQKDAQELQRCCGIKIVVHGGSEGAFKSRELSCKSHMALASGYSRRTALQLLKNPPDEFQFSLCL